MIDINSYRSRIGQFSQKISLRKYLYRREFYYKNSWDENNAGKNAFLVTKSILKIILIIVLLSGSSDLATSGAVAVGQVCQPLHVGGGQYHAVHGGAAGEGYCDLQQLIFLRKGKRTTTNFLSRYLYGNIRQKGIKNLHLNIRSLRYKVI